VIRSLLYRLPRAVALPAEELAGMARSQALAYACAKEVASHIQEGWSEIQAARLLDVCLRDRGVRGHFHKSFAWFGERTRFDGMARWLDFRPSARRLGPGEAIILDTAPVYRGHASDIGRAFSLSPHPDLEKARAFLAELRGILLELFDSSARGSGITGAQICEAACRHIRRAGYDVVHHRYPGAVLGHRLHAMGEGWRPPLPIPFSWKAVEKLALRGVAADLLNEEHRGELWGAWAIEPHLGGGGFGAKFEEVLVVEEGRARWLAGGIPW